MEERDAIEELYKNKKRPLKVIFCTSTLAAGVNLPAKRVIIAGIRAGAQSPPLSSITYRQMIGRAGRYGLDKEADSILCVPQSRVFEDKKIALQLLQPDKMEPIISTFGKGK